jgi:hypothetical protein
VRADERAVLDRAIRRVTEQAANADAIVDDAMEAGLDGSDRIVVSKQARARPSRSRREPRCASILKDQRYRTSRTGHSA